jgi:hypothetical protein
MAHINRCPQDPVQGDSTDVNECEGGIAATNRSLHDDTLNRNQPQLQPQLQPLSSILLFEM